MTSAKRHVIQSPQSDGEGAPMAQPDTNASVAFMRRCRDPRSASTSAFSRGGVPAPRTAANEKPSSQPVARRVNGGKPPPESPIGGVALQEAAPIRAMAAGADTGVPMSNASRRAGAGVAQREDPRRASSQPTASAEGIPDDDVLDGRPPVAVGTRTPTGFHDVENRVLN